MFDNALGRAAALGVRERASSLTGGRTRSTVRPRRVRQTAVPSVRAHRRAHGERAARRPGSAVANYWLVVGARGREISTAWMPCRRAKSAALGPDAVSARISIESRWTSIPERARMRRVREQVDGVATMRAGGKSWKWKSKTGLIPEACLYGFASRQFRRCRRPRSAGRSAPSRSPCGRGRPLRRRRLHLADFRRAARRGR